jgi:hypothetical protein
MHNAAGQIVAIIGNPYFWALVLVYWLVSNAVSALPKPDPKDGKFYGWFFKFANGFNGNLTRALAGKIPGTDGLPNNTNALAQPQQETKTP